MKEVTCEKFPGWTSCAAINFEWQDFIEKENYKKLNLEVPCLDELNVMIPQHKRHLVHHIWFEIELSRDPYSCSASWNSRPESTGRTVRKAIRKLFTALSTWQERQHGKLTLELNVISPSDSEHWFKPLYFSDGRTGEDDGPIGRIHDPRHGWVDGRQVSLATELAVQRLFRPIKLDSSFTSKPLPRVIGVTGFVIRRQLRRCISPAGLGAMLGALPSLKSMSYEPWAVHMNARSNGREHHLRDLRRALLHELSRGVTNLVVFEDSPKFYKVLPQYTPKEATTFTINSIAIADGLGDAFAKKSCGMKHLAVSFMVDAQHIFRHCKPSWTWSQLKSVALTSQLLRDSLDTHDKIGDLLCRAAALARQMPELETFVLWNGGKDNACAFIYRVDGGDVSIAWRGTWRLEMSPDVVKAWEAAASIRSDRVLTIHQERISSDVNCVGDAIHHLKLPCQVAEPASLWQIRREGNLVP
ncbi:hypothetical protein TrVGV298_009330 [Trichoderma virens]|nr:hypothetical protein TrVGV298_009330 [Trichoderma virens]